MARESVTNFLNVSWINTLSQKKCTAFIKIYNNFLNVSWINTLIKSKEMYSFYNLIKINNRRTSIKFGL